MVGACGRLIRRPTAIFTGILFSLGAVVANRALAQVTVKRLFLLEDVEHHQWCAYGSESEWASEVKSLTAMVVAYLGVLGRSRFENQRNRGG